MRTRGAQIRLLGAQIKAVTEKPKDGKGVSSLFIDTIVICSATAFMCMCSGVEATADAARAAYIQACVSKTLGGFGPIFITAAMVLFAFTTLIGNLFYVDKAILHILKREPSVWTKRAYYILASLVILLGAGLSAELLWNIADILMGLMTIINVPVIFMLSKYAFGAIKDYDRQRKQGNEPVFYADDIGLPQDVDYWQRTDSEEKLGETSARQWHAFLQVNG